MHAMEQMPTWRDVGRHIVLSTRDNRIRSVSRSRVPGVSDDASGLLRIDRGVYLDLHYLAGLDGPWAQREAVDMARTRAVSHRSGPGSVIHGESAALVHGLRRYAPSGDIHLWHPWRPSTLPRHLPGIRAPGLAPIPECRVIHHHRWIPPDSVRLIDGAAVLSLEATALTAAMSLPEERGFTIASAALTELSYFDRRTQEVCRVREEEVRADLLSTLEGSPPTAAGRVRARRVLTLSDAGCESVGEARLLWILRSAGIPGLKTQVRTVCGRRIYFVDIGVPGLLLAIEFDGLAKYGSGDHQIHEAYLARDRRQQEIEELGIVFIRFLWSDLADPERVVAVVRERLSRLGVTDVDR